MGPVRSTEPGLPECARRPTAWYCYLLRCADGTLYAGVTTDVERRLGEHNRGVGSKYTRSRLPVELAYAESHPDRASASRRERELKALPRSAKLALVRLAASENPAGNRGEPPGFVFEPHEPGLRTR